MHNNPGKFLSSILSPAIVAFMLWGFSTDTAAWGADGHTAIGVLAIDRLNVETRDKLEGVLGSLDDTTMMKACNWPDEVHASSEWQWTSPRHYINIPREESAYLQARDCPDQLCATQAIKQFAVELNSFQVSEERRWQAFAWLCHLVGDLHQPLHAGFADDRGGNDAVVIFNDEEVNLHSFWDRLLIEPIAENPETLVKVLRENPAKQAAINWTPSLVDRWTNESHQLAATIAYPASKSIDESFHRQSWTIASQQMVLAADRLAQLINTVFQGD